IMRGTTLSIISFAAILSAGCGGGSGGSTNNTPANTASIVSVGRAIFFDENLSSGGNQSCASCHDPAAGFADPGTSAMAPVSEGSTGGEFGNRNAPTAAYASFSPRFRLTVTATSSEDGSRYEGGQFLDGRRSDLVAQAKDPFLNPVEMNNADAAEVVNKVRSAGYVNDFLSVFGANALDDSAIAYDFIAQALAAFETSPEVNRFTSKFDAFLIGQYAMTASEMNGLNVFSGNKAKCANCHVIDNPTGGPALFTNFKYFNVGTPVNTMNPAYVIDSTFRDEGLAMNSNIDPADLATERGKFKVPSLRNIELTAPYMHNGVYETLDEVVTHYDIIVADSFHVAEINENIASELNPFSDMGLGISTQEKTDLINFMKTLTDGYM
ncbi:MAG: cytochrome c peroxidase, partial [Thiogranum sp.]